MDAASTSIRASPGRGRGIGTCWSSAPGPGPALRNASIESGIIGTRRPPPAHRPVAATHYARVQARARLRLAAHQSVSVANPTLRTSVERGTMVRLVAFGVVLYVISLVSVSGLLRRSARRDAAERAWLEHELPRGKAGEGPDRPP